MTDDLARLQQQLGVFQDEEEMRMDVAARVVAQSSDAALEDEERLKASWRALEAAEHAVNELQQELGEAQMEAATQESTALSSSAARSAPPRRVSDIRFQLAAAERELKRADAAVRQTQKDVDRRHAARMAEAKRKEQADLEAERVVSTARAAAYPTAAAAVPTRTAARAHRPVPLTSSSPSVRRPTPSADTSGGASTVGAATPAPSTSTTTRVLYRVPAHLKGVTQTEYSGGDILPSLSRVHVTRADIQAKQRRYQDDSEMQHYVERIRKRQRLEAVASQQRRLAAAGGRDGASVSAVAAGAGAAAAAAPPPQVKLEAGVTGSACPAVVPPTTEAETSDDDSVIDVDALMEDHDDAAVAAAINRASAQVAAGALSASPSQNSQQQQQQQLRGRAGSVSSATLSESEELVLEMEEVTLLPGVRMDAAIYGRLLDYQQEGLQWLLALHARRCGGILGDEMGLGKTIQIAALINALHHSEMLRGPVLIVTPMTVLRQWLAELHRWAPYVRSCVLHESSRSGTTRDALLQSLQGTSAVVLTTYAAMRVHCELLQRTGFQYVILDEGHKISNPNAGVTLAAKSFTTPHRIILSGSPIQNSLRELWCLFDFVRPALLGTLNSFTTEFEAPISLSRDIRHQGSAAIVAVECAMTLQAHIAPYLLRRLKRQVRTSLPPKYERVLRVPLTDEQLDQYVHVLSSPVVQRLFAQTARYSRYGDLNADGRDSTGALHIAGPRANLASQRLNSGLRLESFRLMNQLRQICNHADIYAVQRGTEEDESRRPLSRGGGAPRAAAAAASSSSSSRPGPYRSFRSNNPVNLLGSGKLQALLMMLKEWHAFGHRVLVFSQTRMMLDIIENMCEEHAYSYIRMDGATSGHHRQELMDRFNEDDSIFVALLTTRVGGIGVNLVGADRVVIFDPDWNPITDVQARERAWRIGQTRDVCVYRLITSGSVEETILRRQLAKMYVTDKVLKDPELQRFFHVQDSFMESFLLGAEYTSRVALDKRYLLAAHHLNSAVGRGRTTAGGSRATATAAAAAAAAAGEYSNAVPGVDSDDDHHDGDTSNSDDDGPALRPTREQEFGMLVPIKAEDDAEDVDDDAEVAGDAAEDRRGSKSATTTKGRETRMLRALVDHQNVAVAGTDSVAQRLARHRAEDKMRRVSSSIASAADAMREQQRQYSLLHAIEAKKAQEAVEREEKGRCYRDEVAAAATRKRRRT